MSVNLSHSKRRLCRVLALCFLTLFLAGPGGADTCGGEGQPYPCYTDDDCFHYEDTMCLVPPGSGVRQGTCVPRMCYRDSDCNGNKTCNNGACVPRHFCGNGTCDEQIREDACSCPEDCGDPIDQCECCPPDTACIGGECVPIVSSCGDGACDEANGENRCTCPEDCGDPIDLCDCCPPDTECFDGVCVPIGPSCGDDACDEANDENRCTCPEDCGDPIDLCDCCPPDTDCIDGECVIVEPVCGDGVTDPGEECDDGGESASCDADCTPAVCGDGMLNESAGEECDDGNNVEGDGCAPDCTVEQPSACGDGVCDEEGGEDPCSCSQDCGDPQPEICDGLDNNCDEQIDEGFGIGSVCDGLGECGVGVIECADLAGTRCSTEPGGSQDQSQPESCNGLDSDCDGTMCVVEDFSHDADPALPGLAGSVFVHAYEGGQMISEADDPGHAPFPSSPHALWLFSPSDVVTFDLPAGATVHRAGVWANGHYSGGAAVVVVGAGDTKRVEVDTSALWQAVEVFSSDLGDNGVPVGDIVRVELSGFEAQYDDIEIDVRN